MSSSIMQLTMIEECLMLRHAFRGDSGALGAEAHVEKELIKHYPHIAPEEGLQRFRNLVFSPYPDEDFKLFLEAEKTLFKLFIKRKYDVTVFIATKETVERDYPDGPPEIPNINHDLLPPHTLQLGLMLLYFTTDPIKGEYDGYGEEELLEAETEEQFQKRKDWHDWLNGYLNQEAIREPLFTITDVMNEQKRIRNIVNNHIRNLFDGFDT